MLTELFIKNLAVIDELRVEFAAGFQVLTGDTGAGKSILVEAIGLVLGDRADTVLIRDGADSALVEGLFMIRSHASVAHILEDEGIAAHDDPHLLVIRRILLREGSGRVQINGQRTTITVLRRLALELIDFTSQYAQQELLDAGRDIEVVDSFLSTPQILVDYQASYLSCRELHQEITLWQKRVLEKTERLEWLDFQLRELALLPVDSTAAEQSLLTQREHSRHAGAIRRFIAEATDTLSEGEGNIVARLSQLGTELSRNVSLAEIFKSEMERLQEAVHVLQDLSFDFSRRLKDQDCEADLSSEVLDEKIHNLTRLKRKYGPELSDVLSKVTELTTEKKNWLSLDSRLAELQNKWVVEFSQLQEQAGRLSAARLEVKARLEQEIYEELKRLGMEKAQFLVVLAPRLHPEDSSGFAAYSDRGRDVVQFLLSPNPGLAPRPLAKIASGGELSRLFLALKQVLSRHRESVSFIFDEIDTGISGAMVEKVGQRLRELSRHNQVFCITHHAQIASLADRHILVEKKLQKKQTITRIRILEHEERVQEMARLMGGEKITDKNLDFAKELLQKNIP